jgi:hypothetical protein
MISWEMIKSAIFSEIFICAMYQKRDQLRIESATFYLCLFEILLPPPRGEQGATDCYLHWVSEK